MKCLGQGLTCKGRDNMSYYCHVYIGRANGTEDVWMVYSTEDLYVHTKTQDQIGSPAVFLFLLLLFLLHLVPLKFPSPRQGSSLPPCGLKLEVLLRWEASGCKISLPRGPPYKVCYLLGRRSDASVGSCHLRTALQEFHSNSSRSMQNR